MVASRTASHRKKLNSHADSTKLVKPSRRIARLLRHLMMPCYTTYLVPRRSRIRLKSTNSRSSALERRFFS